MPLGSATPQKQPVPDAAFLAAVDDSHLLLAFLARRQLRLDETERAAFKEYAEAMIRVQTLAALDPTQISDHDRAEFWDSFIFLSNLASPATIESIRYYFNYYYRDRPPFWTAIWNALAHPRQRAKTGGRLFVMVFTVTVFVVAFLLSLAGFIGNRTVEQYARDYRYYYELASVARLASYDYRLEAHPAAGSQDLVVQVHAPPPDPKAPPGNQADAEPQVLSGVTIPEDHALPFRSALPQLFSSQKIGQLDMMVWTPACIDRATGNAGQPCARVRDVILAEELGRTLLSIVAEQHILDGEKRLFAMLLPSGWVAPPPVANPLRWLGPNAQAATPTPPVTPALAQPAAPAQPQSPVTSTIAEAAVAPAQPEPALAAASSPPVAPPAKLGAPDRHDQCLPLPPRQLTGTDSNDPALINRTLLAILCRDLPFPTVLPRELQDMQNIPFQARLALDVLDTYLLAFIFGLLGACVHIVRDLHKRLDDFTLTTVMLTRYKARLILGGVAGPFISLFVNPIQGVTDPLDTTSHLATHLSGLGLAFLAGFSVEVLFSILDKMTGLLSDLSSSQSTAARPPATPRLH